MSPGQEAARYIYCVVSAGEEVGLGAIGIQGHEVYTVVRHGLGALVHDCVAQPYQSDDGQVAAAWVLAHHRVVDAAWRRWGTVLPLTFNTIIAPGDRSAEENLAAWLEAEHESLKGKLDKLVGKAEYGVQIFWDPMVVARKIAETSPEVRGLEAEIQGKPRGIAYMHRQKLEAALRREMEARAEEGYKALYGAVARCVERVHIEKTRHAQSLVEGKAEEGRQMIMNLSCLVSTERLPDLEMELERVSNREGLFVRLAGPLPPYSFC